MIDARLPCDEGVLLSEEQNVPCPERRKRWTLAAAIIGSSMAFVTGSVVNVALPAIQTSMGATTTEVQWVMNANLLLLSSLLLVGGAAGDRYGRKRMFMLGIILFGAAAVWCGAGRSITELTAASAALGVGSALLVPNSLAVISATFPAAERGRAIGTWAAFSALTTALGPLLGGWLIDTLSWRWCLWVPVPLGVIALPIVARLIPESRNPDAERLDVAGAVLCAAALGAVVYSLVGLADRGPSDPLVAGTGIAGIVLLVAFVLRERSAPHPMLPFSIFRSANFSGANVMTLLLYFALTGVLFFLPFSLMQVHGYSATQAGAAFLPFTLPMGLLSRWSGGLIAKIGAKIPLVAGGLLAALGIARHGFVEPGTSFWTGIFPAMLLLGLDMAVAVAPLTTVVMSSVPDRLIGTASGINNAAARLAGLLAVALLGTLAVLLFSTRLDDRLATIGLPAEIRLSLLDRAGELAALAPEQGSIAEPLRTAAAEAIEEAYVAGYRIVMLVCAGFAALGALVAMVTIRPEQVDPHAADRP